MDRLEKVEHPWFGTSVSLLISVKGPGNPCSKFWISSNLPVGATIVIRTNGGLNLPYGDTDGNKNSTKDFESFNVPPNPPPKKKFGLKVHLN